MNTGAARQADYAAGADSLERGRGRFPPAPRLVPLLLLLAFFLAATARAASARATSAPASPLPVSKVAEVGDPAPGFGEGIVFEALGKHPLDPSRSGGPLEPHMDDQGNATFSAYVGDDGIVEEAAPPLGIWRRVDGNLSLIARDGDPAPGTGSTFAAFPSALFPRTPFIARGRTAFLATTEAGDFGLWSDVAQPLALVVRQGDHLPLMAPGASLGHFNAVAEGEIILVNGEIANSGTGDLDPEGLWRLQSGQVQAVVASGQPAPGVRRAVFGQVSTTQREGSVGAFDLNGSGRVAFAGFLKGRRVDKDNDEGIWLEDASGQLHLFLRTGDRTPIKFDRKPAQFGGPISPAFRRVELNDAGRIAFQAFVDPKNATGFPTLWTNRDGVLELIVKGSRKFVAGAEPGDRAPGTDTTFVRFPDLAFNGAGEVLFSAIVDFNDDPFNPQRAGLWIDRGQGVELVAVEGGPVPGVPGATFVRSDVNALRLPGAFALEADGTVLYHGTYVDDSGNFVDALFRQDADGSNALVLREGDEVAINGSEIRTVSFLHCNVDEATTAAGEKVCELAFADGSAGIYKVPGIQ